MKPIAIVCAQSNRTKMVEQVMGTLSATDEVPIKIFTMNGMELGEMRTVNILIKSIDYDWEYLVRSDDDMWYDPGWLAEMWMLYRLHHMGLLGGCRYPTHKIKETKDGVHFMDIAPGNNWLVSREVYEKSGGFFEDFIPGDAEDVRYCRVVREMGWPVGCLENNELVVHCGLTGTNGKGRSKRVMKYSVDLCKKVGAYYK